MLPNYVYIQRRLATKTWICLFRGNQTLFKLPIYV